MLFVEPSNLGINYCGDVINGKICRGFCIGVTGGDSKAAKICQHVDIIQIVSGRNDVVLGNAEFVGKRADSGAFSSAARNGIEIKAVRADVYPLAVALLERACYLSGKFNCWISALNDVEAVQLVEFLSREKQPSVRCSLALAVLAVLPDGKSIALFASA